MYTNIKKPPLIKIFYIYLLFLITPSLNAQNLIPNPSFEDVNVCQKYKEPCSPKAWRSTLLKGFVYGEYLGSKKSKNHDPIIPPDGNRYISLRMFNKRKANDRTFVQVPLLCPLEKDQKYQISFQFYSPVYHIREIGMAFTKKMSIHHNNSSVMEITPQVSFPIDPNIKHRTWNKVSATFIATGNEVGLIFGNFKNDASTEIKSLFKPKRKQSLPNRVYYVFDDFSLQILPQDSIDICPHINHLNFLYKDTTRHIPNRPIITIEDYPILPNYPVDTSIATSTDPFQKEPEILRIGKQIIEKEEDFVISDITFETNSAILQQNAYAPITELILFLQKNETYLVDITGHTDNIGGQEFNLKLSKSRAASIAKLLKKAGIHSNRITTAGKGESAPIADNNSPNGRSLNRRVTFRLVR